MTYGRWTVNKQSPWNVITPEGFVSIGWQSADGARERKAIEYATLIAAAPDMAAELEQAALELTEAANLLETELPCCASLMRTAADKKRALLAKATGKD